MPDTDPNDTAANDTAANDTAANDTAANDTAANDTAANDTAANDTAANDTAANDDSRPTAGEPRASGPGRGPESGLQEAGAVLGSALVDLARTLLRHSRSRARRAAETGRVRLDLRQLRRDRDVMYQKLGREVIHLVEGGEVHHPGLIRGVQRIRKHEERIAEIEAEAATQLDHGGAVDSVIDSVVDGADRDLVGASERGR